MAHRSQPIALENGGPGKGGGLMTGMPVRESMTVSGEAKRARMARLFVAGVLGPAHPCAEAAALLVSELFGNSVQYSGSGSPGGTITVSVVIMADGVIRVEVADCSGPGLPQPRLAGRDAENGRGLELVAVLSARWGWRRRGSRTVTWFEVAA